VGGWGGASGFGQLGAANGECMTSNCIQTTGTRDRTDYGRMIEQWRNDARGAWIAGLNSAYGREAIRATRFVVVNGPRIGARFIPGLGFAVLGYELYKNREAIAGGVQSIINAVSGTDSDKQAGGALTADAGAKTPDLPSGLTGDNPREGSGNRVNTDLPGGSQEVFDSLTGGKSSTQDDGTKVGANGVRLRPGKEGEGPRIDIPSLGPRPHETIHFPPGT
jgi:hypothetical protein